MSDEGYNEIKIRVTSTSDQVTADWEKVKAKGKELGDKTIRIPVEATDPVTEEWRRKVQAAIKSVGKEALKIPMDPNSAEFRAEVASTLAELRSIAKEPVPLEMADADKFRSSVEAMVETVRAEVRGITVPVTASRTAGDVTDLSVHQANDNPASLRPAGMVPAKITIVGDPYADAQKKIGQEPEPVIPIKALDPIDAAWVAKVQAGVKAAAKDGLKIPTDPKFDDFRAKLTAGLAGVTANLKAGIPLDLTDRELFRAEAEETVKSLQAGLKLHVPVEADTSSAGAAGSQMSGLILAAVGAGLMAGGPLIGGALVGGTTIGMAALGAYLQRGNPAIQQGWQQLAQDAKAGAQNASQSIVAPITGALGQIDAMVIGQEPTWKRMFASAGQDVPILTGGIVQLADNALPGLDHALANSTGISEGLAKILAETGGVIGGLGDATAKNSSMIGTDLGMIASTVRIVGQALDSLVGISTTLGHGALPVLNAGLTVTAGALHLIDEYAGPLVSGLGSVGTAALLVWLAFKGASLAAAGVKTLADGVAAAGTKLTAYGTAAKAAATGEDAMAASSTRLQGSLGSAATGLGGFLSKLGTAGLIGIGAGVIGVVTAIGQAEQAAAARTAAHASAVQSLSQAMEANNTAGNTNVKQLLEQQLQSTNLRGTTVKMADAFSQLNISQGTVVSAIQNGGSSYSGLVSKLKDIESGANGATIMQKAMAGQILATLPSVTSSYNDAKTAAGQMADAQSKVTDATNNSAGAFTNMVTIQDTAAHGFANLVSNMADATSAESDLQKATSALLLELQLAGEGGMQKANDAIRAFANDLANDTSSTVMKKAAGDILDASGALDNFSQRGRDVAKILEDSQSTWAAYATGAKQAGVSTTGMTTELNLMQGQLEKTLEGMGLTKAQADKLITSFGLIPPAIATSVTAPGAAEAFTNVTDLANELKALPPGQSVTVTGITSEAEKKLSDLGFQVEHMPNGTVQINANTTLAVQSALNAVHWINGLTAWIDIQGNNQVKGSVHMQAAGGPSSGPSIIHDQGPEAVRLPTGSMVIPHANTNAMMNQMAAPAKTATVEVHFGGNTDGTFATAFMNLVRTGQIQILSHN